jgi:hypothetical protein
MAADAADAAHGFPRMLPILEADIPAAWLHDWHAVKRAHAAGDNSTHLCVEVPDTLWGWAYHDFLRTRNDVSDIPVMVSSVQQWSSKKVAEFNRAIHRTGKPCHWTRICGQA